MRAVLLSLAVAGILALAAPRAASALVPHASAISASASYDVQQPAQPERDVKVDINVNRGGAVWYRNPLWIAVAILAVIVLLLIILLATRSGGGGTTIIRE